MSHPVITAKYNTPLTDLIKLLRKHEIRHLPIVNDGDALIGIVSNRDMLVATNTPANIDGNRWASHIMTPDPIVTNAGQAASIAAKMLLTHHIGCLPVMEKSRIIGIVTESDFVRFFAGEKDNVAENI